MHRPDGKAYTETGVPLRDAGFFNGFVRRNVPPDGEVPAGNPQATRFSCRVEGKTENEFWGNLRTGKGF